MTYSVQFNSYLTIYRLPSDDFEGWWVITTRPWSSMMAGGGVKEIGGVFYNEDGHQICLPKGHPVLQDNPMTDFLEAAGSQNPLRILQLTNEERLAEHRDYMERRVEVDGTVLRYKEHAWWFGLGDTDRFFEEALYMRFVKSDSNPLTFAAELTEIGLDRKTAQTSLIKLLFSEHGDELTVTKTALLAEDEVGPVTVQKYFAIEKPRPLQHG